MMTITSIAGDTPPHIAFFVLGSLKRNLGVRSNKFDFCIESLL